MPQLHFYVPEETAQRIRRKAKEEGLPLSRYIAKVVSGQEEEKDERGWPKGYFERLLSGPPVEIDLPDDPPFQPGEDAHLRW